MDDRPVWRHLLARADEFLTAHPDLVASGKACRGLGSGGRWMAAVLGRLRNEDVRGNSSAHYGRAGWRKYAPCLLVAAIVAAVGVARLGWLVIVPAAVTFYAMEAQTVFLFPLLADHGRRGQRALRALNHRAGGTLTIMTVVLPLAAKMTLGGLADGRFRRSWLQGCVAVVIWYEDLLRTRDGPGPIFEFSALQALTVRRVTLVAGNQRPLRLVYASDLHIGARAARPMFPDLVRLVARERPDLVLLGGDLVDTQRGLPSARWDLAELARLAPVAAVPGNHDVGVGLARVRDVVIEAGGHWLDQEPLRFGSIDIDARPGQSEPRSGAFRILCAHDPEVFDAACVAGYDLVLAGHLHGGQIVLSRRRGRDYPAAWFYRWNGPTFQRAGTTMLVSRGGADTFPLRFRCPREVLLCAIGVPSRISTSRTGG